MTDTPSRAALAAGKRLEGYFGDRAMMPTVEGAARIIDEEFKQLREACEDIVRYYQNMSGNPEYPVPDKYWLPGALKARSALKT